MSVLERHPLSDDEGLDHDEAHDTISDDMPSLLPVPTNRGRRVSVSAESIQPSLHPTKEDYVCHPKTDQQRESINAAIANNFLFKCLDDDQRARVIDTMAEKRVKKGDVVIKQGDEGDYYYVVESGTFDCFLEQKDGPAVKATSYGPCDSFGELALMYNAPRAATIVATSDGLLWALDRMTFRSILMDSTAKKRRMYEHFLAEVPILKSLELYERHKIADALEPVQFDDQDVVMAEGDVGENFYLIEDGEAVVYQNVDGQRKEVNRLKKGDYFGELALLHDRPRAATVIAKGKLKCVTLGKKAFTRLLGPVMDILKRNSENYHAILQEASKEP